MDNIGKYLKEQRESLDMTIEEAAQQTKLKDYIIEQIENNDFEAIGDAGFTKIMVITYCRAVDGREDLVLRRLSQLFDKRIEPPTKITSVKNKKSVFVSPNHIYFALLGVLVVFLTFALIHLYRNEAFSFNAIREQLATTDRRDRTTSQPSELSPDSLWLFQRSLFNEINNIASDAERAEPRTARADTGLRNNQNDDSANSRNFNASRHFITDRTDYVGELLFDNAVSPLNPVLTQ